MRRGSRIGLGLAFTNLAAAKPAAQYYYEQAAAHGWEPDPDQVVYGHLPVYLADTDEQAFAMARAPQSKVSHLAAGMLRANRLVAQAGFFGSRNPSVCSRFQNMGNQPPRRWRQQLDLGMFLCGAPTPCSDNCAISARTSAPV